MILRQLLESNTLRKVAKAPTLDRELKKLIKAYPEAKSALEDFIEFRRNPMNDGRGWIRKDTPFHGMLARFRHVHLVYGKVVLVYRFSGDTLYLLTAQGHISHSDRNLPDLAKKVNTDYRRLSEGYVVDGLRIDNPGGEWLQRKQKWADEAIAVGRGMSRYGITGSVTAEFLNLPLSVDFLRQFPGHAGENRAPGDHQYDRLKSSVDEVGFIDKDPILIMVNHRGNAYVWEGNTRIAVASTIGHRTIKTDIRYWNGAEDVDGPCSPDRVRANVVRLNEAMGDYALKVDVLIDSEHPRLARVEEGGEYTFINDEHELVTIIIQDDKRNSVPVALTATNRGKLDPGAAFQKLRQMVSRGPIEVSNRFVSVVVNAMAGKNYAAERRKRMTKR